MVYLGSCLRNLRPFVVCKFLCLFYAWAHPCLVLILLFVYTCFLCVCLSIYSAFFPLCLPDCAVMPNTSACLLLNFESCAFQYLFPMVGLICQSFLPYRRTVSWRANILQSLEPGQIKHMNQLITVFRITSRNWRQVGTVYECSVIETMDKFTFSYLFCNVQSLFVMKNYVDCNICWVLYVECWLVCA